MDLTWMRTFFPKYPSFVETVGEENWTLGDGHEKITHSQVDNEHVGRRAKTSAPGEKGKRVNRSGSQGGRTWRRGGGATALLASNALCAASHGVKKTKNRTTNQHKLWILLFLFSWKGYY